MISGLCFLSPALGVLQGEVGDDAVHDDHGGHGGDVGPGAAEADCLDGWELRGGACDAAGAALVRVGVGELDAEEELVAVEAVA